MGTSNKPGGQRGNLSGGGGPKARSETSTPHKGSRVEPSHITEQQRETREKKAATRAAKATPAKVTKKDAKKKS